MKKSINHRVLLLCISTLLMSACAEAPKPEPAPKKPLSQEQRMAKQIQDLVLSGPLNVLKMSADNKQFLFAFGDPDRHILDVQLTGNKRPIMPKRQALLRQYGYLIQYEIEIKHMNKPYWMPALVLFRQDRMPRIAPAYRRLSYLAVGKVANDIGFVLLQLAH